MIYFGKILRIYPDFMTCSGTSRFLYRNLAIAVLVGIRYVQRPTTLAWKGFCCTSFVQEPLYFEKKS